MSERRVYVLPDDLLARVREAKVSWGLTNETEAVRRLLDAGLNMMDGRGDIAARAAAARKAGLSFREIWRSLLSSHRKVTSVRLDEAKNELRFTVVGGGTVVLLGDGTTILGDAS